MALIPLVAPDPKAVLRLPTFTPPPIGGADLEEAPVTTMLPSLAVPKTPDVTTAPLTQQRIDQQDLQHLVDQGPGYNRIANPFVRNTLHGLDTALHIGGALFAPLRAVEAATPGTNLNHQIQVRQQEQRVQQDRANALGDAQLAHVQAQTAQENAETDAVTNPQKAVDTTKTVSTDDGVYQINPTTGHYDIKVGDNKEKPANWQHIVTDSGIYAFNPQTQETHQLTGGDGQPLAAPSKLEQVTTLGQDGKPHTFGVNSKGQRVVDYGVHYERPITVNNNAGTLSLDSIPDGKGGTKTVLFNNKTGKLSDAPDGLAKGSGIPAGTTPKMTVADQNRASLGKIALNNLDQVQEIVNRRPDLLGKMGAIKTTADLFGSNDPDLVALGNEVHNFAMANAGIHGSRSFQNVQNAEQELLGHFKNGAKGIQGGIDANRRNLQEIIAPNAGTSNNGAPPPGAKVRDYTQVVNGR